MQHNILRCAAAATAIAFTLLTVSCGGGGGSQPAGSHAVQPTTSPTSAAPSSSSPGDGMPTGTPSGSATENDLTTWVAHANNICQTAIDSYHQAKAQIGSDNPEGLAAAAAIATRGASNDFAALTAPTSDAEQLTAQVRKFADDEHTLAAAMSSGSFSDEDSAFDALEETGRELAATATVLGADECVTMTQEV